MRRAQLPAAILASGILISTLSLTSCGGSKDGSDVDGGSSGGSSAASGPSAGSAGTGRGINTGSGGLSLGSGGLGLGTAASANDASGGAFEGCTSVAQQQEESASPLDIYFIFDRTASMGTDCAYVAGDMPPVASKACFATYALSDYLINVDPIVDTRLAFQFMSLAKDDCDGTPYATPLVDLTPLPVAADHQLIQAISDEQFKGGLGTHIEGALRGLAQYTPTHATKGREMIGVLMTDGDPSGCEEDGAALRKLVSDQLMLSGTRTFVIGMQGATDANLENLASAGGADPHDDFCGSLAAPCHYWNVGQGSGEALGSALQAIIKQAAPLPCEYGVSGLKAPPGENIDFDKINVTLTDSNNVTTTIGQAANAAACPTDQPAWYYDDPTKPSTIQLCDNACTLVTGSANGSRVDVVVGCVNTVVVR